MSGLVTVRNQHPGPTVFNPNKDESYEWQGYGDPNYEDFQELNEAVTRLPQFRKMVARGVFQIVEDDEDRFTHQGQIWQHDRELAFQTTESMIDRQSERSIAATTCVGPGQNGTTCDSPVVLGANSKGQPPLCNAHKHLSASYANIVDENGVEKWVRAGIDPRTSVIR